MLILAVVLFAVAALGGIYLARRHLAGHPPPVGFALVHGLFATAGLVALILFVLEYGDHLATIALLVFFLAALGGLVLLAKHLKGRTLGKGLITVHAGAALFAFLLLLITLLS